MISVLELIAVSIHLEFTAVVGIVKSHDVCKAADSATIVFPIAFLLDGSLWSVLDHHTMSRLSHEESCSRGQFYSHRW